MVAKKKPAKQKNPVKKKVEKKATPLKTEIKTPEPEKKIIKPVESKIQKLLLFNKWATDFPLLDPGLKQYINVQQTIVPFSAGRHIGKQFWKSKKNIVERLINKLMVTGHKGKKHYRTSKTFTGKLSTIYKIVEESFKLIEKRKKMNPVEIFIRAIENASPREGIATIEYGGVGYPKAVDLAPQRRIDLTLRWLTQGAYISSAQAKTKKAIHQALADEIIAAYEKNAASFAFSKRQELERIAAANR